MKKFDLFRRVRIHCIGLGEANATLLRGIAARLLDQVRLFASARGIAGPPGAAFTNLMWAPAGARVLTIFTGSSVSPFMITNCGGQ